MSNAAQSVTASPVVLETRHEAIATIVLNRPDRLNALNAEITIALNEALGRDSLRGACR